MYLAKEAQTAVLNQTKNALVAQEGSLETSRMLLTLVRTLADSPTVMVQSVILRHPFVQNLERPFVLFLVF